MLTNKTRKLRHPSINHTFTIKDINLNEIEIDGVRFHKKDCDWMVMMANHGAIVRSKQAVTLTDLSLPILQLVLSKTISNDKKK